MTVLTEIFLREQHADHLPVRVHAELDRLHIRRQETARPFPE